MNIPADKLRALLYKTQEVEDQFRLMGLDWSIQIVKNETAPEKKWASFVYLPDLCDQNKILCIKLIRFVTGFDLKACQGHRRRRMQPPRPGDPSRGVLHLV